MRLNFGKMCVNGVQDIYFSTIECCSQKKRPFMELNMLVKFPLLQKTAGINPYRIYEILSNNVELNDFNNLKASSVESRGTNLT